MLHLIAAKSPIAGIGLFTVNRIEKDTLLGVFQSRPTRTVTERAGPHGLYKEGDGTYVLMLDNFRFLNHATVPNVCLWEDDTITALVDIPAGTELVSNYGEAWLVECEARGEKVVRMT